MKYGIFLTLLGLAGPLMAAHPLETEQKGVSYDPFWKRKSDCAVKTELGKDLSGRDSIVLSVSLAHSDYRPLMPSYKFPEGDLQ